MTARSALRVGALALPVLAGACATNGEAEKQVQRDLAALRQDLRAVNLVMEANRARSEQQIREIAGRADEGGRGRAALLAQLQELVTEIRLVQGRLEENARAMGEANRRGDRLAERLEEAMHRLASLNTQVVSLEGQIQAQQERVDQLAGRGMPVGAGPVKPAPAEPAPATPPSSGRAEEARLAPESADQIYRAALTDYTRQKFELAVQGFQAFARNFPRDSRAADAQYWLAESYRAQGNYAQAAKEFDTFVQTYRENPRFPTAQVRLGESLLLGGDKGGCAVLQEVRARHARARAGILARDLMVQHCP